MQRRKPRQTRKPKGKLTKDAKQDKEIRRLKRLVGHPEVKYIDTAFTPAITLTTAGSIFPINGCAQGDQAFNRNGAMIKQLFIRIKGYVTLANTEVDDRLVRILLVRDIGTSGSTPSLYANTGTGAVAIIDNGGTAGLIPNVFSPKSMEYRDRFKVMYDKIMTIHHTADNHTCSYPFSIHMKCNIVTRYDTNTSAVTSIASNGLFFACSVENVVTTAPILNMTSRVYFVDN